LINGGVLGDPCGDSAIAGRFGPAWSERTRGAEGKPRGAPARDKNRWCHRRYANRRPGQLKELHPLAVADDRTLSESILAAGKRQYPVQSQTVGREMQMTVSRRVHGIVAAVAGMVLISSTASALETKPTLSLDLAKKMAAGCEAKAKQEGWKMNIAVVNDGANLVFFEHMDGSFLGSIYIAQHKAMTSANFPGPTRAVGEMAFGKDGKGGPAPGIADIPGVIAFAGGLPIFTASKVHIGGIGASGGTSDQDEACAQAGLDAVKDDLK
jgi:glc operon protein GlcG